jgi:Fe-S cluster assembly protein SufD
MPTTKDEPWRRTDIRALQSENLHLPSPEAHENLPGPPAELLQPLVGERHGGQIVLYPGGYAQVDVAPELSEKGVVFTDLLTAEKEHPQLLTDLLGQVVPARDGKFAALASAMAPNGILLYVPRGVQLELPLHSVVWGPGLGLAHFSHLLVWVEEGASLTYVHESASPDESPDQTFHAGLVEMHVSAGANLRFVELQSWGDHVWNFTHERARVEKDAQIDWILGSIGTSMTKSFLDMDLNGSGASGRMSGFFFTDDRQHLDLDTQQNHNAPNTTSDLLYKGALEERSRTVWQGMIYVAPGAQKTDGYQANRNLVLSTKARADSIPGLEIQADDVRCTHGATVGKIDPELVFYLRSRGLPFSEAKRLVVEGFFDPVMQRIPYEGVRDRFQAAIMDKLKD